MRPADALYHYTCDHGHAALCRSGLVLPLGRHSPNAAAHLKATPYAWMAGLCWFTDLARPRAVLLGLTSNALTCDRTRHRWRVVDTSGVVPWLQVSNAYPAAVVDLLNEPPHTPEHWWVAGQGVPVEPDPWREP